MQSRALKSFARFESDWTFRESVISLIMRTSDVFSDIHTLYANRFLQNEAEFCKSQN